MMSDNEKETNAADCRHRGHHSTRRAFLKYGVPASVVIGFGIRKVLAQAVQAGKPWLTAASVNRLTAESSEQEYREICAGAQRDLKAFVRETFYLTPEQEEALNDLAPEHVQKIQNTLNQTLEHGGRYKMEVRYVESPAEGQSRKGLAVLAVRDSDEEAARLKELLKKKIAENLKEAESLQKELEEKMKNGKDSNFFEKLIGQAMPKESGCGPSG